MKRIVALLIILCASLSLLQANRGFDQRFTPEEFRVHKEKFIIKQVGLSQTEAKKFFPVYHQYQERKRGLNEKINKLYRQGKRKDTTEKQYKEMLKKIVDMREELSQVEEDYLEKFSKVLSYKKIYLVQRAEMQFNQQVLKGMKPGSKPVPNLNQGFKPGFKPGVRPKMPAK